MATRTIRVNLEVPEEISDKSKQTAQTQAEEAVILALWKAGELSTRRAASELGLAYRDFLDLLAARGIPVVRGPLDQEALEDARQKLASDRP
jgi:hypothetical protein